MADLRGPERSQLRQGGADIPLEQGHGEGQQMHYRVRPLPSFEPPFQGETPQNPGPASLEPPSPSYVT
jgi:hypothetical protein